MKKSNLITIFVLLLFSSGLFAQVSFLGFDNEKCYIIENSGFSYENIFNGCGSHSGSYVIYHNGNIIYESTCQNFEWWSVSDFFFIDDSTGYYMEHYNNANNEYSEKVLKTTDYGQTWDVFMTAPFFGPMDIFGFFLLTKESGIIISRASYWENQPLLLNNLMDSAFVDTVYNFELSGFPLCDFDTLEFQVLNNSDTITYKIATTYNQNSITSPHLTSQHIFFPNPANNILFIRQEFIINSDEKLSIYNCNGLLVKEFSNLNEPKIYIGDLNSGLYLMELNSKNNRFIQKVIIE